jgi:hypothetical protein
VLAAMLASPPALAAPESPDPRGYEGPTEVESQEQVQETEPATPSVETPLGEAASPPDEPTKGTKDRPESAREQEGAAMLTAGITTPFWFLIPHADQFPTALVTGFFGGHIARRTAMGLCAQIQTDSNVVLHSYQVAWMGRMGPRTAFHYLLGVGPAFLAGLEGMGVKLSTRLGARITGPRWKRHGIVIAGTLDIGLPVFIPTLGISFGWAWM